MSTSFRKSKEKRPQPPSESNTSFVKNVTSRVSGLLPTITKWFSSPRSSKRNGSAQATDATDSSTEDEAPESPVTIQPPAKRMRYSSPGNFNQPLTVETKCASTNTDPIHGSLYSVISPPPHSDTRRESNLTSHRKSSPSSNADKSEKPVQDVSFLKPQRSLSVIESTNSTKRKSLYVTPQDDAHKKDKPTGSGNARDPYFKPSLLSSPFYVGRTRYGGAASSYVTSPSNQQRRISVINESNSDGTVIMSQSTRQIMDLLEHYSSPLSEARRIPQVQRYPENRSFDNSLPFGVYPYSAKPYSYKNQELYVPSVADILTIKRKSRLMESTSAARQIIASHSSSSADFSPYTRTMSDCDALDDVLGERLTTKMKSRLTRNNRERNMAMESNTSETVNLPNVVLQIDKDNLPKFTFGPTPTSQSSSIQTPVIITPEALKRSAVIEKAQASKLKNTEKDKHIPTDINNDNFKFSSPVPISVEANKNSLTNDIYDFGSPDRNLNKTVEIKQNADQLTLLNNWEVNPANNFVSLQTLSDWKCLDCWVMNKTDINTCVCCGGKKPVEIGGDTKKCSVCKVCIDQSPQDKCNDCEKNTFNVGNSFANKGSNTKWQCNVCWVDNNDSTEKCACCGGTHPRVTMEIAGTNRKKFLRIDSLKNTKINRKETFDSAFKNITMIQKEKWECSLCLVRNESSRTSCICCDANKPGSAQETITKFNFHQPSQITFKFGIQPKYPDIDIDESSMGEESETNNNILPKTSPFNFGIPAKKMEEGSESSMDKPEEAPNLNFTFGVSKVDPVQPVRCSVFVMPNKETETNNNTVEREKLQEVPQMFMNSKSEELLTKNLDLFNKSITSPIAEMPAVIPMNHSESSIINKDSPFSTTSAKSTMISESKPENNFTFPSIMPTGNLFAPLATSPPASEGLLPSLSMSAVSTSSMPLFQPTVTTTISSFFQKTEPKPNLGPSMFPKTETTTTSTETLSNMQPVFSFGGSQGATQQPTEKPKFNFNFLNNKTEPAPAFPPAFGVSTDNQGPSNTFSVSSNSMNGGNSMSGENQSNINNHVNTENPLTTGMSTSSTPTMFGAPIQSDNTWPTDTNNIDTNNMFATNTSSNPVQQQPPTFTFGTATQFPVSNSGFGNTTQQPQQTQPTQNVFGISKPTNTTQPSMFGNLIPNQSAPNMFGVPQVQDNPMQMGMFGAPNAAGSIGFGIPNQTITHFEPTPIVPAPAPTTFNFGSQPSTGVFGFGQSQQAGAPPEQQPQPVGQQPGMYNFGSPVMSGPQMQFTIGSAPNAPNTTVRRVRKAMRRTQR